MKKLLLLSVALAGFTSFAQADLARGDQAVVLFGGVGGAGADYSYQPGTDRPVTGGGGAFGAQYLYFLKDNPSLAVGLDVNYSMNGTRSDNDLLAGYDTDQRLKSFVGMVMARLSYPRGTARPYVFGGLGGYTSSLKMSATPRPGTSWPSGPAAGTRTLVDKDGRSVAVGFGIGLDLFLRENIFFGTELRGTWLAGLTTDDTLAVRNAGFTARHENGIVQGNIHFRAGIKF